MEATLNFNINNKTLNISASGDFVEFKNNQKLLSLAKSAEITAINITSDNLGKWDSSLLLILFELKQIAAGRQIKFTAANMPAGLNRMLELALAVSPNHDIQAASKETFLDKFGGKCINLYRVFFKGLKFTLENLSALQKFITGKTVTRYIDFLFALEDCGPKAVGIVSLISFMVGLILAFVGALQLKTFGAQVYVASLVTIGMIRIMGAIMVGIIMAGRTGASFAATLGTMQVNEEIDALKTMGIPITEFLVLPRLAALVLVMPLLTMLADFAGMLGGASVGVLLLDIPTSEYWKYSWQAWSMTNFGVGIFHGFVFGFIIALCGCYYGINSGRNADGVGVATTKAVVSAIVWMIVATGIITFIFERLGI